RAEAGDLGVWIGPARIHGKAIPVSVVEVGHRAGRWRQALEVSNGLVVQLVDRVVRLVLSECTGGTEPVEGVRYAADGVPRRVVVRGNGVLDKDAGCLVPFLRRVVAADQVVVGIEVLGSDILHRSPQYAAVARRTTFVQVAERRHAH